jgi:hypothetical protein
MPLKENLSPGHGLDQAKDYAEYRRHNVQFIFTRDIPCPPAGE